MPNYKFHLLIGLIFSTIATILLHFLTPFNFKIEHILTLLFFSFFMSLLPDTDIASSRISRIIRISFFVLALASAYFSHWWFVIIIFMLYFSMEFLAKHRGFMHSLLAGIIGFIIIFIITDYNYYFAIISFSAFISHLIIDKI